MIYYIGERQNKILGSCVEEFNNGFDDENGDYKIIIGDQIGFWFEILEVLGSGSFG